MTPEERQILARLAPVGGAARAAQLKTDPEAMAELKAWTTMPPDFLAMHDRKKKHRVFTQPGGLGPNWNRIIAGRISEGLRGRTFTAAERAGHAKPPHNAASREKMLIVLRTPQLKKLSRLDLLLIEDLADQPDTKAWIRSRIEPADKNKSAWSRGLKGFQIGYTLDQVRKAGYKASSIAKARDVEVSERHARDLLKLVNRADAARAHSPNLIGRLSIAGL